MGRRGAARRRLAHADGAARAARSWSTSTPPGGCSRWSARCTGKGEAWHGRDGPDRRAGCARRRRAVRLRHEHGALADGRRHARGDAGSARLYIASAGVRKGELDPFAVAVMEEMRRRHRRGTGRRRSRISRTGRPNFDLVITLSPEAHHRALELTRTMAVSVEYWPTADPTRRRAVASRGSTPIAQVRDQLQARIRARFASTAAAMNDRRGGGRAADCRRPAGSRQSMIRHLNQSVRLLAFHRKPCPFRSC